jgi:hypothetical protein
VGRGEYKLIDTTPVRAVASYPRRFGVMFNPASSRSRLRVIDSGRRYAIRLRDGVVEYSLDDAGWRPIAPLPDPCSGQVGPAFVTHRDSRAGRALDPVSFDALAVGRGRVIAKEAGTDRLFHLVMDDLFRTHRVLGVGCDVDVDVGCRDEDPPVPGYFIKLDPEFFTTEPPSVVVPDEATRDYGGHPASRRLPAFAELLRLELADLMLVMQRPRTWYEIDARSPRSIIGPEDVRFDRQDLVDVLTKQRLRQILDVALAGWDNRFAKWLLDVFGQIDWVIDETRASIVREGVGGIVVPALAGVGMIGQQLRQVGALTTEDGKLKLRTEHVRDAIRGNKPLQDALRELMLRSRRRATAWRNPTPGMPTPNQPPQWMPTYEHLRYIPARRYPSWDQLDDNTSTVAIVANGDALYQRHRDGKIWRYTGPPMTDWQLLDDNPATHQLVASGGRLYQRHEGGAIFKFTGQPMTGWQRLDDNPATMAIAADGDALYQLHRNGRLWRYTGTPMTGWQLLDDNPATLELAASGGKLYQRHAGGAIFRFTGTPLSGWQRLDDNAATSSITADGDALYQLHADGAVFRFTGTPMTGWQPLASASLNAVQIAAAADRLYVRRADGHILRFGESSGWIRYDDNAATIAIAAGGAELYQLHASGSIFRSTGPPAPPPPDEPRYSIEYSKVLDLGVGYSHWSEQWMKHWGGEIHSLLARRPLFQDEQFPLVQYRFLNGPITDGDGSIDGTTNFYMLVKLGTAGAQELKQRYAVLWIDEQTYFTQRWRLLHPTEDILGDLASLPHLLRSNPDWFHFADQRFWSPFRADLIRDDSRMAVRRHIVAITGYDPGARRHEIYTCAFNFGICDHTWRWRPFPSATQVMVDPATAQDERPQLPAAVTSGPDAAYVAVNTLDLRDDSMLHARGSKRLAPGETLRVGRWVQRYLPADCRHAPEAHRLVGADPPRKPAVGYAHPWDFLSETAYGRADRFYQFGVYEEDIDSRCQYYEIQLLPGADGTTPSKQDVTARIWHNGGAPASFPAPAEPLHHNTTHIEWSLARDATDAIPLNDQIRNRRDLPTMSMYEKTTRFRILDRRELGLIAVFYDKRDDELQAASDLPHETLFEEDFEDAAIPPEWRDEQGGEACGPTPIPRPPKQIRLLVKRHRPVLAPPNVPEARVVIERTTPKRALRIWFWTPQTEAEVAESIFKVSLAALDENGAIPIFSLRRATSFVRKAKPAAPFDPYSAAELGDAWRYDCRWTYEPSLNARIDRLCTARGRVIHGTSLWFEDVVGHRSLPDQLVFG